MARLLAARSLPSPRTRWRNRRRVRRTASGRSLAYNLRFPGQYYQTETGLNQNWNRDYDPLGGGRYVESDPLGLWGGLNTYAYAYSNPLSWSDPNGTRPPGATAPGISIPLPVPPIVVPGTPENNAWVQNAYQQINNAINAIVNACSTQEPDCVRASAFHLANAGITDPEEFKKEYVGNAGGKFDICACKDGSIVLAAVGQCGRSGPKISTGVTWKK